MIDTMVFLLMFFMIASLAMSKQKGLPVALPSADTAPQATWSDRSIVITEKTNGSLYIDKQEISRTELVPILAVHLREKPDSIIVINADESLKHKEVIWLMDEARKAGAMHMAIATNGEIVNEEEADNIPPDDTS